MTPVRLRFGLLPKIVLFLALVLVPLAAITWYVSVRTLRQRMTEEFTSKGTAIANSLASSGVDLILTRDASTVQALIDQFGAIGGVAYVMVYDRERTLIAHTFVQLVPVTASDEIGQLADTFNHSIVRLRSLVQTESERDEERRKREELQRHITKFLDTVTDIARGDLT